MTHRYAEDTKVAVAESRTQVEALLRKAGAQRILHMDEPVNTITSHQGARAGGAAPLGLVAPHLIRVDQTSGDPARKGVHSAEDPVTTIATAGGVAVVTPLLVTSTTGHAGGSADAPLSTITTGGHHIVAAPFLVPRYGERPGQDPRTRAVDEPAPVIVPTGNEGSLAAVHLSRQFGASVGSAADEPVGTITAGGAGKAAVVAAFLAQHNTARGGEVNPGCDARAPVSTITAAGGHQNVVAAHMLNLRGSDRRGGPIDAPAPTTSAQGNHAAAVYAFLAKYYGAGLPSQPVTDPVHTITVKPRHGVVTVEIQGEPWAIVDIGMRMLTPRERFAAQGFRPDYVIDRGELEDGTTIPLTLEQQGRMCGNSVCPGMAEALVSANYREEAQRPRRARPAADIPLFAAE